MAKRKSSLSTVVAFMSEQTQDRLRASEGEATVPIELVRPDPSQPRQLLPDDLAQGLVDGELTPQEAMQLWFGRADGATSPSALTHHVRELRRLADSIAQHGLINPVTVRPRPPDSAYGEGVTYLVVTGERRYWAHILLLAEHRMIQAGDERRDPRLMRVIHAAPGISVRAHQLIENLLRENIDAVEKARGFAALRQELSEGGNHGSGQLAPWRVIEESLGISDRYRKYVMSVLRLDGDVQALISEYGLTERMVRPISQRLRDFPELQLRAVQQLVAWQAQEGSEDGPGGSMTSAVKQYVEQLLKLQTAGTGNHGSRLTPGGLPVFHRRVKGVLRYVQALDEASWQNLSETLASGEGSDQTLEDLRTLHRQLDLLLERVHKRQFD